LGKLEPLRRLFSHDFWFFLPTRLAPAKQAGLSKEMRSAHEHFYNYNNL
jgi:hypothetical protein